MNNALLDQIRHKVKSLDAMPTIPTIVLPLADMLKLPPDEVSIDRIVQLVSYDSTIAAQCLRMANSPLFGRRSVDTVHKAVIALGMGRVQAILLGCCMRNMVPANQWALDAVTFWRHSLGCALVSSKMAQLIGYAEPEKAYLAGLLHDVGILINAIVCGQETQECIHAASAEHIALHRCEETHLGFTHCQSGKILADGWRLPSDLADVIEFHHEVERAPASSAPLVSLIHLSDLLCRLRDLSYGYYETMGVELAGESAWEILVRQYPELLHMDLERLTMDIDGAMEGIVATVDAVFTPPCSST